MEIEGYFPKEYSRELLLQILTDANQSMKAEILEYSYIHTKPHLDVVPSVNYQFLSSSDFLKRLIDIRMKQLLFEMSSRVLDAKDKLFSSDDIPGMHNEFISCFKF